jgi:hypothetical protein
MVKLTLNEEKVRKELLKFPNGAKATQIMTKVFIAKSPLYVVLNRLEENELAFRGSHGLWYPNPPKKEQSTGIDFVYEKRLEHSRLLLSVFQVMLEETVVFQDPNLFSAAKDHLRSYDEIYPILEEFEKEFIKLYQELLKKKKYFQSLFYNVELGGPFRFIAFYDSWNPTALKDKRIKNNLGKESKNLLEIYRELAKQIIFLKDKIEHGTPLKGSCKLCPEKINY